MAEIGIRSGMKLADLNALGAGHLPGWFGFEAVSLDPGRLGARMLIRPEMLAPNGFLHAATLISVAERLLTWRTSP